MESHAAEEDSGSTVTRHAEHDAASELNEDAALAEAQARIMAGAIRHSKTPIEYAAWMQWRHEQREKPKNERQRFNLTPEACTQYAEKYLERKTSHFIEAAERREMSVPDYLSYRLMKRLDRIPKKHKDDFRLWHDVLGDIENRMNGKTCMPAEELVTKLNTLYHDRSWATFIPPIWDTFHFKSGEFDPYSKKLFNDISADIRLILRTNLRRKKEWTPAQIKEFEDRLHRLGNLLLNPEDEYDQDDAYLADCSVAASSGISSEWTCDSRQPAGFERAPSERADVVFPDGGQRPGKAERPGLDAPSSTRSRPASFVRPASGILAVLRDLILGRSKKIALVGEGWPHVPNQGMGYSIAAHHVLEDTSSELGPPRHRKQFGRFRRYAGKVKRYVGELTRDAGEAIKAEFDGYSVPIPSFKDQRGTSKTISTAAKTTRSADPASGAG